MTFQARPYQIEDLAQLIATPSKPLLSDAGTGKTPTACMYTRYCHDHLGHKVVWIMPGSIMGKNYDDLIEFGGFAPEEVVIVEGTAEKRQKLLMTPTAKVYVMTAQCWTNNWRLFMNLQPKIRVVMGDEWHLYFSSHKSKRTQEMYQWVKYMFSVVPMTGSMIKGRLDSAYPMFHALFPLYYGMYQQFMARHAIYDLDNRVIGWRNHDHLKALLKKLTIRRSFKEVYGTENKVIQGHKVHFDGLHKDIYTRWKATNSIERDEDLLQAKGNAAIVALRSRQILACPDALGVVPQGQEFTTAKDLDLQNYIEDHLYTGQRLVIFSAWHEEQKRIVHMIEKMGGKVALINGDVPMAHRRIIDSHFQVQKIQFIVASPETAGVGFNWGFLESMIFCTVNYEDESFIQAYRRGIRGKRDTPLRIILMVYRNTIEEYILLQVQEKSRHANAVDDTKDILELSGSAVNPIQTEETLVSSPGGFTMSSVATPAKTEFKTAPASELPKTGFKMAEPKGGAFSMSDVT